jgi:hypothetical protein
LFDRLSDRQRTPPHVEEWQAGKRAALLVEKIRIRLQHGAAIKTARLYFDENSELVRNRKAGSE